MKFKALALSLLLAGITSSTQCGPISGMIVYGLVKVVGYTAIAASATGIGAACVATTPVAAPVAVAGVGAVGGVVTAASGAVVVVNSAAVSAAAAVTAIPFLP